MTRAWPFAIAMSLAAAFAASAQSDPILAQANGIEIAGGYVTSAGPAAKTGAALMRITNTNGTADRLIAVEGDVARRIELHTHTMEGGVARMRALEDGVDLPPGETVTFESGGLNVMLMGLNRPLTEGETVDLSLIFETAGAIPVTIPVLRDPPASAHEGMAH